MQCGGNVKGAGLIEFGIYEFDEGGILLFNDLDKLEHIEEPPKE
jgi:hypothetical protein